MTAVDEWRWPPTADLPRILVLLGDRGVAGPAPPLPSKFAPLNVQRCSLRQNRIPRDPLNPVGEIHQRCRVRTDKSGTAGVGLDLRVVLSRISQAVLRVELIIQLQGLVAKGCI